MGAAATGLTRLAGAALAGILVAGTASGGERSAGDDPQPDWRRASRPAMGTIVGITVRPGATNADPEPTFAAAYAAVEAWEERLSEWREGSLTSRMNRGETVELPPEADAMFARAEALRITSGGAFSLTWAGGRLVEGPRPAWRVEGGAARLGGILKGFLVDRAAEVLAASPFADWIVDAAGDVRAAGDAGDGRPGWPVAVLAGDRAYTTVRLRDAALSTSGGDHQPDHILDGRTGAPARCLATVSVVAPDGETADALATALYAGCAEGGLVESEGAFATWIDAKGRRGYSAGARRRFR